jgi:hypothetical protein
MQFAYVTFVTLHYPYVDLMKSTFKSVIQFSKHPIIVYCVDETVLNLLYWKYNCQNHHLPIIDPFICSFHECKAKKTLYNNLDDIILPKIII